MLVLAPAGTSMGKSDRGQSDRNGLRGVRRNALVGVYHLCTRVATSLPWCVVMVGCDVTRSWVQRELAQ